MLRAPVMLSVFPARMLMSPLVSPVREALTNGLLDEITLHVVPVLLGDGVRLLDDASADLELVTVVQAPGVTHVTYSVVH